MKLQGMIFDLDGTLADTIPVCIEAFQHTFQYYLGQAFTDRDIEAMFGPNEEGMLQRHLPNTWPQALNMYLVEYERAHANCQSPFTGITPLLTNLRARGLHLGIVTGKGLGSARISARVLGLDPYFDGIEVGSADGAIKQARIRALLTRWAVAPQVVAYIGDAPTDIDAAKHAGVVAVAAAWAASASATALAVRQPDVLFRRVADFAIWAEQVSQ
jgi:pyrophosphatase PpaX